MTITARELHTLRDQAFNLVFDRMGLLAHNQPTLEALYQRIKAMTEAELRFVIERG